MRIVELSDGHWRSGTQSNTPQSGWSPHSGLSRARPVSSIAIRACRVAAGFTPTHSSPGCRGPLPVIGGGRIKRTETFTETFLVETVTPIGHDHHAGNGKEIPVEPIQPDVGAFVFPAERVAAPIPPDSGSAGNRRRPSPGRRRALDHSTPVPESRFEMSL